jgi:hypothetical protein
LTLTARDAGVATQMGNQGHSGNGVRELCEMIWSCGMKLVELFKIIILKIDLKKTGLSTISEYESLRQELGVQINTALSGPRAGQWIGGRVKNKKIFLFFRVSDPPKAKQFILRLLNTYPILSDATIRIKGKSMKWRNYTFI